MIFNEKLKSKYVIGILMMLVCVGLVSNPVGANKVSLDQDMNYQTNVKDDYLVNFYSTIGFGLLAPIMISLFITLSRYWTEHYGYKSQDFTVDTFFIIALVELPFWYQYQTQTGYTLHELAFGMGASFFMVCGTLLMIYASTYGLAGPTSAMVQCQGLVHTLLSAFILGQIPSISAIIGLCFAITGALIMGLEFPCFKAESETSQQTKDNIQTMNQQKERLIDFL